MPIQLPYQPSLEACLVSLFLFYADRRCSGSQSEGFTSAMVFFPGLVEFMMAKELEYFIRCRTKDSDFVEFQAKFEEYEGPSCEKVKGIKILRSNERLGGICTVS